MLGDRHYPQTVSYSPMVVDSDGHLHKAHCTLKTICQSAWLSGKITVLSINLRDGSIVFGQASGAIY